MSEPWSYIEGFEPLLDNNNMSEQEFRKLYLGEFIPEDEIITLQYFNGKRWMDCQNFTNERMAWLSLGGDDMNYRTALKTSGITLTDKSV
jgi:hypothetical protein